MRPTPLMQWPSITFQVLWRASPIDSFRWVSHTERWNSDARGGHCLLLYCRRGPGIFKILSLREEPVCLPSIFSDSVQPARSSCDSSTWWHFSKTAHLLQDRGTSLSERGHRQTVQPGARRAPPTVWWPVWAKASTPARTVAPAPAGEAALYHIVPCLRLLPRYKFFSLRWSVLIDLKKAFVNHLCCQSIF